MNVAFPIYSRPCTVINPSKQTKWQKAWIRAASNNIPFMFVGNKLFVIESCMEPPKVYIIRKGKRKS